MRSVHSTNADRRFKVSQDFVPRKELFSVLDIMAVEPITMRLCFRSVDLKKKKKKLYVPAGCQGWIVGFSFQP